MSFSAADHRAMEQALALAVLADGGVSPNPRVGSIVVRDGATVGLGHHLGPGLPHAEVVALERAGAAARGATLYVNLEPCAHVGRTPPCTDAILAAGVARVVAGMRDPDPRVNGRGFAALERAGVRVEVGLLEREARRVNAGFCRWHAAARPRVTLKAAVSFDGMLAAAGGRSQWITGAPARRFAHRLRFRHDAVLVGAGTVRADDPLLTVRLRGVTARTRRVVLSQRLDLDPRGRMFREDAGGAPPPRIYTTAAAAERGHAAFGSAAEIVAAPERGDGLDLAWILGDLGGTGVQSLLVEGGGRTHAAFVRAGCADAVAVFVAPLVLGHRGGVPWLDGAAVDAPAAGWRLARREVFALGADTLHLAELRGPDAREA